MRNFFVFLWKQYFFFLFLFLEVIAIILVVQNSYYQRTTFINSANSFSGSILGTFNNISEYFSLREANKRLAEENARLLSDSKKWFLQTDHKIFYYNDTLYRQQYEFISAKVVKNTTSKRNNYLLLNKGSNQGITNDMGVVTSNGIVGIVKDVSPNFCSVISVLHKESKISAKLKKYGQIGTVVWNGGNYRFGELIDIPTHVKPTLGDTIITSGYSTSFPEGILIGTISDFKIEKGDNFYSITVRFATDFNSISYANVIRNLMKDEIDKLEKDSEGD
jgi:rod shape-determining protein MreC